MKRIAIILISILTITNIVFAQEIDSPELPESIYEYEPIRKGDKLFIINLGVSKPLFNVGDGQLITQTNIYPGGNGSLGFFGFLNPYIALGGDISFSFSTTHGENLVFLLPLLFTVNTELLADRFLFPFSLGIGASFLAYNGETYFGPLLRPRAGVYYKYSPDWSFGFNFEWFTIFEFAKEKADTRIANSANFSFGFRYHF